MEKNIREALMDKMFAAALKETYSQLARKYDAARVLEIWTRVTKAGGAQKYFAKERWEPQMTLAQALDLLDDYRQSLESLVQKRQKKGTEKKKK